MSSKFYPKDFMKVNPRDTPYVDDKNSHLLERLERIGYSFALEKFPESYAQDLVYPGWHTRTNGKSVEMWYFKNVRTSAYFTHELLHIDLVEKGFTHPVQIADGILNQKTIDAINNSLAHQKFFWSFVHDFKYPVSEFTCDFGKPIDIEQKLREIEQAFNDYQNGINVCVSSFCVAKDNRDSSKDTDYEKLFKYLKDKNTNLVNILSDKWKEWDESQLLNNKEILSSLATEVNNLRRTS